MREARPRDTIERMYERFLHIYSLSQDRSNDAYARKMLEHDIELLGFYFGLMDPIEQQTGFSLLAECLGYLRVKNSMAPVDKVIDSYIETILTELRIKKPAAYPISTEDSPREMLRHLHTLRLSQQLLETGYLSQEQDDELRDGFTQLANFFLLRDGNVTAKEMQAIAGFEEALKHRGVL